MKKKSIGILILGIIIVSAVVVSVYCTGIFSESSSPYYKIGKEVAKQVQDDEQQVIAQGKNIEVSLEELELRIKVQEIDHQSIHCEEILNDLIEEKTLYQKAIEKGLEMDASDADVQIQQLKDMMDDADNTEQLTNLMKGFGNDNEYWEYVKQRIIVKESVQNYKDWLVNEYDKKKNLSDAEMDEKIEKTIASLVLHEKIKIETQKLEDLEDKYESKGAF